MRRKSAGISIDLKRLPRHEKPAQKPKPDYLDPLPKVIAETQSLKERRYPIAVPMVSR
jgi:hypothetical protein